MLDVVHKRGQAALDVGSDALLHLLGLQAGIVPHQADDRDVDFRENVRGSAHQRYRRQQNDDERHHHERVWPAQR